MATSRPGRLSRAELLRRAGAGAAALLVGEGLGAGGLLDPPDAWGRTRTIRPAETAGSGFRVFRSRPDLRPQLVTVLHRSPAAADGYLFLAPNSGPGRRGVMIVDDRGDLVWFHRTYPQTAMNFRSAVYKGKPALTWWEGKTEKGLGVGTHVVFDDTYAEVARFGAGRGRASDLHELLITPRDTALVTSYERRTLDLRALGGRRRHTVIGGVVQEIEIPSTRVLFEWRSLDHVGVDESHSRIGPAFDYFHVNSIDMDAGGDFLVSARNTWALYKISRKTGKVLWRLGGKKSDFTMGRRTTFAWQHDARHHGGGDRTISLFDDGAAPAVESRSRALVLALDHRRMRVTVEHEYRHTGKVLARAMGNAQLLAGGDMLVGWGTEPYVTEFARNGKVVFDARLPHGGENYRAFRLPWVGRPSGRPALVALSTTAGRRLYVSWNGATEVASWQLRTGTDADSLEPEATGPRQAFETMIEPARGVRYAAVAALDRDGRELAVSDVVRV